MYSTETSHLIGAEAISQLLHQTPRPAFFSSERISGFRGGNINPRQQQHQTVVATELNHNLTGLSLTPRPLPPTGRAGNTDSISSASSVSEWHRKSCLQMEGPACFVIRS
ncbi:hypothetical protein PoB_005278100 [Plakobranchus ocellatus]|uniref:Uncharacterized protein n=1 Tax=Plakobranchus ocellatus TaxID=259542 RepID=A0AAV4BSS7_9GAST|nr:hypothetical protein PoB_005278100 [Plakobranchus ocellatus]